MIMAAGLGSRLRPFTEVCPKPYLPLLSIPIIQYVLDLLQSARVSEAVVNYSHLPEVAKTESMKLDFAPATIRLSDESFGILGSAGGVRQALPLLGGGAFFLCNADVLAGIDFSALAKRHFDLKARLGVELTMVLLEKSPGMESYREIQVDSFGERVIGLGERKKNCKMFSGFAVAESQLYESLAEGIPAEFVDAILIPAIKKNRVGCLIVNDWWMDLGTPQLWWDGHWQLIQRFWQKTLPKEWMSRIAKKNHHFSSLQAMVAGPDGLLPSESFKWAGPCYWGGDQKPPRELGPGTVCYESRFFKPNSISFGGSIVEFDNGVDGANRNA